MCSYECNMWWVNDIIKEGNPRFQNVPSYCSFSRTRWGCYRMTYCPCMTTMSFKIVSLVLNLSTFMSSFRLHAKGLAAGHLNHIFLLDALKAIKLEVFMPLTKFFIDTTNVIVTKQPYWLRSKTRIESIILRETWGNDAV